MTSDHETERGVSPMYGRYAQRTAETDAGFVLPLLRPGMSLLDVGCGLGSITLGLAETIAPGNVVGIDVNEEAILKANDAAAQKGSGNATFEVASIYDLPFEDESFDSVFAHMVFMHLQDPAKAAVEVSRVLKPSGFLGLAERAEEGDLRANSNPTIELAWELFMKWHGARGSDLHLGNRLRALLREAGFQSVRASAVYGNLPIEEAKIQFGSYFRNESVLSVLLEKGWADEPAISDIQSAVDEWTDHPDTMWQMAHVEAIGWKP